MRAIRHRTVICGCLIAALCATACLNDDEKSGSRSQLSAEQKAIAIASTAGNYDGHVFFKNSDTNREDSVKTTWTVSGVDSTCTIGRLNVALFANYMPAGQDRDIVASAGRQSLKVAMHAVYVENHYYEFALVPRAELTFTTLHEGEAHTVAIAFAKAIETTSAYGQPITYRPLAVYRQSDKDRLGNQRQLMQGNLLVGSITVDQREYPVKAVCGFLGEQAHPHRPSTNN